MATSASPAPTASERPRRGGRLGYVVIGVLTALLALGWTAVLANVGQPAGIAAQTVAFSIPNDSSVQIRYQVAKPKDTEVRCAVYAFGDDFGVVAHKEITVPPGAEKLSRTDTLQTSRRAVSARITECRKI
ncbi:DUF4307 domain-containing protein [Actinomadura keratinilytica]|jgi:hypothetical protein|uniref:DUF4307 domain-containing protein n=1 Tax=Actinomadura keratinilytica TaxID=547461 RepID=A0ABP7Y9K7_9ACTN